MKTTMASSICPLCKSPSGVVSASPLPSRLCNECRSMLSTILPQAVAGSVVIVDSQKLSPEAAAVEHQDYFAETNQPSFVNETDFAPVAKPQPVETIVEPTFQTNAPINGNGNGNGFHAPVEPVFFHTEEPAHSQTSTTNNSQDAFYFQTETKPKADYRQTEEKLNNDYAAYLEAAKQFDAQDIQEVHTEESVNHQYVQAEKVEEPVIHQYAPAQETVEVEYIQPEEVEVEYLQPEEPVQQFGFMNAPQKSVPYVEHLEKEPEEQRQNGHFVVAPEVHQPYTQENLYPQEMAPQQFYAQQPAPPYTQEPEPQQFYGQQGAIQSYAQEFNAHPVQLGAEDSPDVWDPTVDNYPVLMVQEEKRPISKSILAIAAVALLAIVAAAGYWFVYKPMFGGSNANPPRAVKTAENNPPASSQVPPVSNTPAAKQEAPASAAVVTPTPAPPEEKPAATPEEKPVTPSEGVANPEVNGQGKISLQAASFPSEQAANEFSEKLIRSGVPTYIASANIPGKGKWYRVRVGRFMNAADAEKYAAQAKQRAKATGLNLDLVVCDYSNQ